MYVSRWNQWPCAPDTAPLDFFSYIFLLKNKKRPPLSNGKNTSLCIFFKIIATTEANLEKPSKIFQALLVTSINNIQVDLDVHENAYHAQNLHPFCSYLRKFRISRGLTLNLF